MNREQHIESLAKFHRVTVERIDREDYTAWWRERRVQIPGDLSGDDDYLAALHEIGHIVMGDLWYATQAEEEFVAWAWAFSEARGVDQSALRRKWECFETYLSPGHSVRYKQPAPTFAHKE